MINLSRTIKWISNPILEWINNLEVFFQNMFVGNSTMLKDSDIQDMAKAVLLWLEYQIVCKREMFISESSLRQPIIEFLQNIQPSSATQTEWPHPNLQNGRPGRPRSIDFALFSRNKKYPETVIEMKWIGKNSSVQVQDLLNDVLRLECVRGEKASMPRYFLLAGHEESIDELFQKQANQNSKGKKRVPFITEFLPNSGRANIRIIDCEEAHRKSYLRFYKSYKIELPKSYIIEQIGSEIFENIQVLIWKVGSSQKRQTFIPTNIWNNIAKLEDEIKAEENIEEENLIIID